jgi:hypothetical protein
MLSRVTLILLKYESGSGIQTSQVPVFMTGEGQGQRIAPRSM